MKHQITTLFLFCLGIQLSGQITSDWRSLNRDGIYPESNLQKQWAEGGPDLIWYNDSLPKGYSSPAIGKDLIYLTGLVDSLDYLIAIDHKGMEKWRQPIGIGWIESYSDSRSTPTLDNDRIYVQSGTCIVACFDAKTGKEIWKVDAIRKFKGTWGVWGYSESLLIVNDKVLVTPGGDETTMVALDKMTGKTIWKTKSLKDKAAYVSPILIEQGGKQIAVNVLSHNVFGVDVEDGKVLFSHDYASIDNEVAEKVWPTASQINTNTPLYHNGELYVTSGYNHIGAKFKIADDLSKLELMWKDTVLDVHFGGAVLIDGYIYGSNWISNAKGNWCCINWETGKTHYEEKWKTKGNIIAADGMLYVYDEKRGNMGLVRPTPDKFDLVSSFRIKHGKGPHWGHPVIKDGVLYVRHANAIMAYNIQAK